MTWESFSIVQRDDESFLRVDHENVVFVKSVISPCECAWVEPYGFVPEADCPEHDTKEFVDAMNEQFGSTSRRNG